MHPQALHCSMQRDFKTGLTCMKKMIESFAGFDEKASGRVGSLHVARQGFVLHTATKIPSLVHQVGGAALGWSNLMGPSMLGMKADM